MQLEISVELRRAGIAASTIRDALRPWIESERDRIIVGLAAAPSTLDALLKLQVDASALFHLKRQLEAAMGQGHVTAEKI